MSISNKTHFDIQLQDNFATEHLINEKRVQQNRLDESNEIIKQLVRIIEQDQIDIYRTKISELTPTEIKLIAKTKEL
tara:strand:+ start:214 stop:444 length:231 start_codon:yes stop_codon:yes gene_type:complete